MGKKRIPSIESDEQLSKMISKQSIPGNGKSIPENGKSIPGNGKSIYEDFCLTHPNVAESIFDKLDNKSLIKCRKVSKVLKNTIRKQTKGLTTHIQHYCKTKKPMGPAVDTQNPNGYRMYFDFTHSFLYCPNSKVNL